MNKPRRWIFFLFFIVSFFFYFYRYPKMFAFDADQEFYANQYLQIVNAHKFTLLGIETSVGGMFVGPLYTYLCAFVYWIFRGDPIGISLITLFFTSLQSSLTYFLFTKLKNQKTGLIAGFLVLISSSLWNKAFAPSAINFLYPMGLIFFYILIKTKEQKKYLIWLGIILALTLQIHFSLFFLFPITLVFLFWQRLFTRKNAEYLLKGISVILISISPLILFDFRHNFFIMNNLWLFLTRHTFLFGSKSLSSVQAFFGVLWGLVELFSHILTPYPGILVYAFLAIVFFFFLTKASKDFIYKTIGLIYVTAIILFFLYRGSIPDYFFYFLLPPFYFVVSDLLANLNRNKLLRIPAFIFMLLISWQNLQFINTAVNHYNYYIKRQVAGYIKEESKGEKVKISYDTDLGLGFGFDYLLKFEGVNIDNSSNDNYHIVIKNYQNYQGKEFRETGSPVSIKVVKLKERI